MNVVSKLIEQVLLFRCQIGDKEAFIELISRYERPLRYFISHLLENNEMTEDIFQDTWLTVIRQIHNLKEIDAFPAWLYRIARNKVYHQLRRCKKLSNLEENSQIYRDEITVSNEAENDVFSIEDAAKVHKCLEKLRPAHKEVLMLRYLSQMSYEQIALVIGCNLGTVKSRIYYAKIALKKEMEK